MKKLFLLFPFLGISLISIGQNNSSSNSIQVISNMEAAAVSENGNVSFKSTEIRSNDNSQNDVSNNIKSIEIGTKVDIGANNMMDVMSGNSEYLQAYMKPNGLIVMFSCNTCPYVIKSQDRTREMIKLARLHNIGFVIINSNEAQRNDVDSEEAMVKYGKEQNYNNYFIDKDHVLADALGATKTPEIFFFSNENILIYKGAMEDNPSDPKNSKIMYLADAMKAVATQKPITAKESKSIGCSIKRKK